MVTKRLVCYKKKLISTFGGVKIHEINGYYVFVAEKKKEKVTNNYSQISYFPLWQSFC